MTNNVPFVDHAEEARHLLRVGAADKAQVHATLALVDAQRIANRIAIADSIRRDIELRQGDLSGWLNEGDGVLGYFSDEEKEAMGL